MPINKPISYIKIGGFYMKIVEEPWVDFSGEETIALSLDKDEQYTVSEFIELLKVAQEKFGNKKILIHEMNSNMIGGFSHVYLHHESNEEERHEEGCRVDDSICIYG